MLYPKIPLAQSIIEICKAKKIRHIVISPGSRNAPLTIGFVNNPYFKCYSIADERCAAFFAIGIAQQIHEPVAVVCTSGSALLNYYPAVAEAFYSQIPLLVISADRPTDKIDIGDGQTIRQRNVFENHSLFNANLTEEANSENDFLINEAINIALSQKGPVHINAPFEEPLYQTVFEKSVNPKIVTFENNVHVNDFSAFDETWNKSAKKLVLIGGADSGLLSDENIEKLANDVSVIVMTEITSNVHHPSFLSNIDTIITPFTESDFNAWQPDLLVTIGGMIVSKRVKSFLRTYPPNEHIHIDTLRAYDTYQSLTTHLAADPNDVFDSLNQFTFVESNYAELAREVQQYREIKQREYLKNIVFSDFKAFEILFRTLTKDTMLQISNSSPIRYAQLVAIDSSIKVFCNRGTSGIDGSTSTAIGAASVVNKSTVFITGDIGFLYDSNAMWNNYIPKDFKIIVINNGGGGIFRILPGHQENEVFNTFFETEHCLTAEHLAKMYRFDYFTASDEISLQENLQMLYANEKRAILEIFTPTKINDKVLLDFFKYIA